MQGQERVGHGLNPSSIYHVPPFTMCSVHCMGMGIDATDE